MLRLPSTLAEDWSDAELAAAGSLVACVLVWSFLAMRLTEGGAPVDVPVRHLIYTYVAAVVAMIAATASIASTLAVRRVRAGRAAEVEQDERDLAIEAGADRVEGWVGVAGINVLIVHAIAGAAYPRGPGAWLDLASPPTLVFALLTLALLAHASRQVALLWLYRR